MAKLSAAGVTACPPWRGGAPPPERQRRDHRRPEEDGSAGRPATEFVRQRLPKPPFLQYARLRDPICAKVVGLPDEYDAFIAKRIVEMAREVQAPVAEGGDCVPNVNVIFTGEPITDIARRPELVHALIIADANKVAGQKIDAVADYIAVLALSRWQGLERCSGLPTILNLMADGCDAEDRPEAATPADLALLTGLYQVNAREAGTLQRAEIAEAVRKAAESQR